MLKTAILKKVFAIIPLFSMLLFPTLASAATLSLSPANATINRGCTLSVAIELNTQGDDTDGIDANLTYDTTKFTISTASIVNGKIFSDYPGNSVSNGKISISGISSPTQPYNGSGTFATINIAVPTSATGVGTIKFDFDPNDKTKTTDTNVIQGGSADSFDILNQVTDGTYTIGTGTTCTATSGTGTGTGTGTGSGSGIGGSTAGSKTLPAGGTTGKTLQAGGPASTESGLIYKQLPESGIEGPTLILTIIGGALTVLGIIGLTLL